MKAAPGGYCVHFASNAGSSAVGAIRGTVAGLEKAR